MPPTCSPPRSTSPRRQPGVEHAHGWGEWTVWGASGVLLLAGAGLVAVRRRKMNRKH
ncbi:MAG: LPXTG cell wall anchor domain-containing protein [Rhodocyclales bacterium]|nr:LPXTG cell wall anchor domain-containing protein [Rhodocyclales bacterium]